MQTAAATSPAKLLKKLESFDWETWNKTLSKGLMQPYRDLVLVTAVKAAQAAGGALDTKDPLLSKFMTGYVMERAKQLDATTKADVADLIRTKFESGVAPAELNEEILSAVREKFDGYEAWRANRIGRTESAIGYNHANVLGFSQAGVEEVEIVDGTDDDICAEANGQVWTLREALADPIGHPNCTRSMVPVVPEDQRRVMGAIEDVRERPFEALMLEDGLAGYCAAVAEFITSLEDPCTNRIVDDFDEDEHEA